MLVQQWNCNSMLNHRVDWLARIITIIVWAMLQKSAWNREKCGKVNTWNVLFGIIGASFFLLPVQHDYQAPSSFQYVFRVLFLFVHYGTEYQWVSEREKEGIQEWDWALTAQTLATCTTYTWPSTCTSPSAHGQRRQHCPFIHLMFWLFSGYQPPLSLCHFCNSNH